jgi:PAS domain S-box-containing protein
MTREHEAEPDLPALDERTAHGARGIFRRFALLAIGLNAVLGIAVVSFDVADSIWSRNDWLRDLGVLITRATLRLHHGPGEPDVKAVSTAVELTGFPMALFDRRGQVAWASTPEIARVLPQIYRGGRPTPGTRVAIRKKLGDLSGAWCFTPYNSRQDLLVVVTRRPEEEGLLEYMTIAAGLTGVGLVVSFVIILIAANWMLRRPLASLVTQLTSALQRDVRRRQEAEERAVAARLEAEEHLAFRDYLIDASDAVGIVATDSQGAIQIFNRAAERTLVVSAAEVVGRLTLEQLQMRFRGTERALSQSYPSRPGVLPAAGPGEELWFDAEDREHMLEVRRNDIRDADGNVRGQLFTFIDVTERRRLQAELQLKELKLIQTSKLATLGEMATGVAHELNQPLNNIGLLSSRLSRHLGDMPAEEQEFFKDKLGKVQDQVARAGRIIDHLRTFGRVRQRSFSGVPLQVPVDGVMVFIGEQLREHGIELKVEIPDDLPTAFADEAQLEQVLLNLLANARDALDQLPAESPKQILIRAGRCQLDGEPGVCLAIQDTGPGMPPAVLQRIFEPFFTTKEVGRGTGLGLSISYGLVRDFGGSLEVESSPGKGSTFSIRLREASR